MSQYIPEARLEEARQIVARGWTEPATRRIVMDPVIAEAIAKHVARRLNELTEALKFYADDDNWIGSVDTCVSEVWDDHGDTAREALL